MRSYPIRTLGNSLTQRRRLFFTGDKVHILRQMPQPKLRQHMVCKALMPQLIHMQAVVSPQPPIQKIVHTPVIDNVHTVFIRHRA